MESTFHTNKPLSQGLTPYIAYYYFHEAASGSDTERFTYYPHVKNALTIYKNSKIEIRDAFTTVTSPSKNGYLCSYTMLYSHFARAEMHAPFKKIGVVFQPLGLNHFMRCNADQLLTQTFNIDIDLFSEDPTEKFDRIFSTDDLSEKTHLLDAFFLEAFTDFTDVKMKKAMSLILASGLDYSVQELADELELNRKALLRMFRKHLNCSVRDYLRVVKFRKAVDHHQESLQKSSLTHLAYEMDYNDQSEFIHHFKKLTGFSPKPFFKSLEPLSNQGTYWSKNN